MTLRVCTSMQALQQKLQWRVFSVFFRLQELLSRKLSLSLTLSQSWRRSRSRRRRRRRRLLEAAALAIQAPTADLRTAF